MSAHNSGVQGRKGTLLFVANVTKEILAMRGAIRHESNRNVGSCRDPPFVWRKIRIRIYRLADGETVSVVQPISSVPGSLAGTKLQMTKTHLLDDFFQLSVT